MRIWLLALLAVSVAACSSGNATTAPPATTAAAYSWSQLSTEYFKLLTTDCGQLSADFTLEATCLSMLKPDMESLRTSAQALPFTKTRTDLTLSVNKFLDALDSFSRNGCFTRPKAIECMTVPTQMGLQHTVMKNYVKRGVEQN